MENTLDKRDHGVVDQGTEVLSVTRGVSRPTLFNLLEVLASDSITTPQQRHSIREIVTEFLANKFEHSKVYSYIGAVVGHDRLHSVIKQLEADPDRAPLPDQNGLMRIESAFNLSRSYKQNTESLHVSPHIKEGVSFNGNTKEEILRSIRRNLNAKRTPQQAAAAAKGLSSVRAASAGILLQKACWLPVQKALTAGALYGHSLVCIGSRAYMLGGSNGRVHGSNFARAHVVSLVDFSSRQITFSGEIPSHREGNSASVALVQQSHVIIIFGGFNGERFFNDVYVLDLEKRKWIRRHAAGRAPAPRDEHSALVYPARCESAQKPKAGAEYLFIFGGKTGLRSQLQCLNDMWAYHIESGTWSQIEIGQTRPCPRFGVCALWADDDTICVFGGETCGSSGLVDRSERCLLSDLWMFKLHSPNSGEWTEEHYEGNIGPRSHYSSIFIAQRCKELHTGVPKTIERLMLLTGGLTYAPGSKRTLVASDKLYFYFFSQRRWYMLKPNYPRNFVGEPFEPRQLHVACFFEKRNILFPGSRPSVPCIFFHGGFHRKQVLSDAWILSLTGEELFLRNCVISPDATKSSNLELRQRSYSPWYYRESHSPDILWAFSSVQRWAFGAIAHLAANGCKESVNATRAIISWDQSPQGDEYMLSIQDDGNGLDYGAMNRLLKLFGQAKTVEPTVPYEYGCGFKMAFGRIASSCVVMSRTHDSIGIGMLSMELMGQCESREMTAPLCMWRLPSKELINKEGSRMVDQRHHQRLLMTYSPFNSATLLAEQINVLGTNPGTRILFWNLKHDLDSISYSKHLNTLVLETIYDRAQAGDVQANDGDMEVDQVQVDLKWQQTFPLWTRPEHALDYCLPVYLYWLFLKTSCTFTVMDFELRPATPPPAKIAQEDQSYNCQRIGCSYCSVAPVGTSLGADNSLWTYLSRRLHCVAELPYLFTPSDHAQGAFALFGFLNDPGFYSSEERVGEAGILLYHKNRLISRLEGHFPAFHRDLADAMNPPLESIYEGHLHRFCLTALVSVPEWLMPSVTKQEFVHENNAVFFDFKSRLVNLIGDYLRLCKNPQELGEWQSNKMEALKRYDESVAAQNQVDTRGESEDENVPPPTSAIGIMHNDTHQKGSFGTDSAPVGADANNVHMGDATSEIH
ncbi:bifunctional Kelch-type beta propeller/Kelch repeat type 2/Histidine kinase-HSP90-like ATPase superfamily [Babesia duncani]|uniref:Bifunctional Kelch-type beta propeller/Kelch repeat type 2/Histidine kinase-HSP90-like ATPase superfamily n=1 Tax=Babesia duncani TaxID=323732 RepID=A0AAD9UMR8_9APIC|nr:bifunctional Kelch-type beta propeller/Kelch repeat type 2/Histidine kinase-HSP90-like ATPase superfamily [Babesia duncani]